MAETRSDRPIIPALIASLVAAAICGLWAFSKTWGSEYVIQDDARSHVVWMLRFIDPQLFPNDIIMDYFQSVAPAGYKLVYQIPAMVGIDPLLTNKILPTILGMIAAGFCFGVSYLIFPIPWAAFASTLFLTQNLWLKDDLISATPRAFFYPLFLGFLYFLLRRSAVGIAIAIALLGAFYPQAVLIAIGVLLLDSWRLFRIDEKRGLFSRLILGVIVGALVLIPYAVKTSEFGAIITLSEARNLPEFYPGGRATFFTDKPFDFWITGDRSGLLPQEWFLKTFIPPQVFLGLSLPLLLKYQNRFPLVKHINANIAILAEILLTSTGLFFLAHLLLFRLHHPSRYSQHCLRIVAAIAGGIALALILDFVIHKFKLKQAKPYLKGIAGLGLFLLLFYPALTASFPSTKYVFGRVPLLYDFFALQPQDTRIASTSLEADNIPAFSRRSLLVGSEYILPYHEDYRNELQMRSRDLIQAQYSPDLTTVQNFIQKYEIDFWLLNSDAFQLDSIADNSTLRQLDAEATAEITARLEAGETPILSELIYDCSVLEVENKIVLDAECIVKWKNR
ncbi:MAG: hypothetical protein ACP5D7_24965 [Limnospira sp.]